MTGSKQGHRRFTTSRLLRKLVGTHVNVLGFKKGEVVDIGRGILEYRKQFGSENAGYFLAGIQIPVRSVEVYEFGPYNLGVKNDYTKKPQVGRGVA